MALHDLIITYVTKYLVTCTPSQYIVWQDAVGFMWISVWDELNVSCHVTRSSCGFLKACWKIIWRSAQLKRSFPNMSDSLLKAAMTAGCGPPNAIALSCIFADVSEVWAAACPVVPDRQAGQAGPRWNVNTLMYVIQPTRCHLYGFYFHCHLGGHELCVKGSVGSLETPWWQVWWCVNRR